MKGLTRVMASLIAMGVAVACLAVGFGALFLLVGYPAWLDHGLRVVASAAFLMLVVSWCADVASRRRLAARYDRIEELAARTGLARKPRGESQLAFAERVLARLEAPVRLGDSGP